MEQAAFLLAISLMFTHELDAIRRHEWRIFPGINLLRDETGFTVFVLLHVPLFAALIWACFLQPDTAAAGWRVAFSIFCIVHVGLHRLFENHPAYEFNNPLSQTLIWGTGVAGALHLIVSIA